MTSVRNFLERIQYRFRRWRYWEASGHRYGERSLSATMESLYRKTIQAVLEGGPSSIVDLGCGDGLFMQKLQAANFSGRLTGIDASASQLRFARQRIPNARLLLGNLPGALRKLETYDVGVIVSVLMYFDPVDLEETLRMLSRRIKRLVLVEYDCQYFDEANRARFFSASDGRFDHDYAHLVGKYFEIVRAEKIDEFWNPHINVTGELGFSILVAKPLTSSR